MRLGCAVDHASSAAQSASWNGACAMSSVDRPVDLRAQVAWLIGLSGLLRSADGLSVMAGSTATGLIKLFAAVRRRRVEQPCSRASPSGLSRRTAGALSARRCRRTHARALRGRASPCSQVARADHQEPAGRPEQRDQFAVCSTR